LDCYEKGRKPIYTKTSGGKKTLSCVEKEAPAQVQPPQEEEVQEVLKGNGTRSTVMHSVHPTSHNFNPADSSDK